MKCPICDLVRIEKRFDCHPREAKLEGDILAYCERLNIETGIGTESYCMEIWFDAEVPGLAGFQLPLGCRHCATAAFPWKGPKDVLIAHAKYYCPVTKFKE